MSDFVYNVRKKYEIIARFCLVVFTFVYDTLGRPANAPYPTVVVVMVRTVVTPNDTRAAACPISIQKDTHEMSTSNDVGM